MEKFLHNRYLFLFCRVLLGGIFIASGLIKIIYPVEEFAAEISQYALLPGWSIMAFAMVLPWIEFISGLLLVSGVWVKFNSAIIGLMLIMFIIAIAQAMVRGIDLASCGCFGNLFEIGETPGQVLAKDLLLLLPAVYLLFAKTKFFTLDRYLLK